MVWNDLRWTFIKSRFFSTKSSGYQQDSISTSLLSALLFAPF